MRGHEQDSPMMPNSVALLLTLRGTPPKFPRNFVSSANTTGHKMSVVEILDKAVEIIEENEEDMGIVPIDFLPSQ